MRLRRSRQTNLALAVVVPTAVVTGALTFAVGSIVVRWIVVAHAVAGLAIVVLSPWKAAISRRGLRRHPGRATWPSVALAAAIVVTVATGLLHSTGLGRALGPVSSMQLHVAAALASVPLFAWHLIARAVTPRRTDVSRRAVLRAGTVGGASLATYGAVTLLTRGISLPGADRRATGSYEVSPLNPRGLPVTQWLDDVPPIPAPAPALDVESRATSRRWSLDELEAFDDGVQAMLDCTGGWYSEQEWQGVLVSRLLSVGGDARSILVRSATGYARRFPVADVPRLLLALRVGGAPLSPGHGAPMRIVAPGRRGFWWVKWVTAIRVDETPWWWQPPFPLT